MENPRQTALRVSEIRYRRLFETARDGVLLLSPETRKITDANPFMYEFLGYTHGELLGKELWEIGMLEDQEASRSMFGELREKHYVRYEDLPLRNKDGQSRSVEVVANLYRENRHDVIQCNIRDITERKKTELQLMAARDEITLRAGELEKTVAERTAQLRETIGELEGFSYSLSHDMRAPLRAMRGFASLLLENHAAQLDAEGARYLKKIGDAAGRLDNLIMDVLTYSRTLRDNLKIEPVDLQTVVAQVIEIYPQLHLADVKIEIEGILPRVMGGETSLVQCVSNLLTNAVKFVAPGTAPRVKIRSEAIEGDIRLWVEDNGIGIDPKDQVRIFNMFERVHGADCYEGTGMGLTIVRKAVERMGGQFGVASMVNEGSKFWIQLKQADR